LSVLSILITLCWTSPAFAEDYLNYVHGNTDYGVNRDGMEISTGFGYAQGNCAHCHEQHASIKEWAATQPVTGSPFSLSALEPFSGNSSWINRPNRIDDI
jgi:hypothetical protein